MKESVQEFEISPEEFDDISLLFGITKIKFLEAVERFRAAPHFHYIHEDQETEPPFRRIATFGLTADYGRLVKGGGSGQFIEVTVPLVDDPDDAFKPDLEFTHPDRWARVVLRRGNIYEALHVTNFKIDNFGAGETELRRPELDSVISQSRTPLEPRQRFEIVMNKLLDYPVAPLRY